MRNRFLLTAGFVAAASLLACSSDPAPRTDTTAVSSQTVAPSGAATCTSDAECVGKPAKPNVQMCVRGSTVQVQCRAGVCAAGCKQVSCTADADCPAGTTCTKGGCAAAAP